MDRIEEFLMKIVKLPLPQRLGILGGILLIIFILYYYLFYIPVQHEVSDLEETLKQKQMEMMREKTRADDLPRYEEELRRLQEKLNEALAKLPNKSEIAQLLIDIPNIANELNLEIVRFEPRPERKKDFVAEVPLIIEVKGPFKNIMKFFEKLGKLSRIVNIRDITFTAKGETNDNGQVIVKARFTAVTYRYLTEKEREQMKKNQKGKKGRKRGRRR